MATASADWTVHNTLVAATVDTITLNGPATEVTIKNRAAAGGADIYFTYSNTGTAPAAPVSLADDTYHVAPGGFSVIPARAGVIIKLISSGANDYSLEGLHGA